MFLSQLLECQSVFPPPVPSPGGDWCYRWSSQRWECSFYCARSYWTSDIITMRWGSSGELHRLTRAMEVLPTVLSPMMTMLAVWREPSSPGPSSSSTAGTRLKEARSWDQGRGKLRRRKSSGWRQTCIPDAGTMKLDWLWLTLTEWAGDLVIWWPVIVITLFY